MDEQTKYTRLVCTEFLIHHVLFTTSVHAVNRSCVFFFVESPELNCFYIIF